MAITLAEAKVGMADKVDQMIVDEFRRSSLLLDRLVFDNAISPGTGGSTLTYGYIQLNTPSTAAVRAINSEYTANEAKRVEKTAKAIIMGGSFSVDRVLQNTSGAVDELAFQAQQKIKATSNYFHNLVINGTSAATGAGYVTGTFDGLKKLLSGTSTELSSGINLSTSALLDSNANAFIDQLDQLVHTIDGDVSERILRLPFDGVNGGCIHQNVRLCYMGKVYDLGVILLVALHHIVYQLVQLFLADAGSLAYGFLNLFQIDAV
jgi:hypothetical protein